jgi:hypothetical protein
MPSQCNNNSNEAGGGVGGSRGGGKKNLTAWELYAGSISDTDYISKSST